MEKSALTGIAANGNTPNEITLTGKAAEAVAGLRSAAGTFEWYMTAIERLEGCLTLQSDEMGLDDAEAMHLLRTLTLLGQDLTAIATEKKTEKKIGEEIEAESAETSPAD